MYYPFLRAKKHELLALLAVPSNTFEKMLPIMEPVALSDQALASYRNLAKTGRPAILITNPAHGTLNKNDVQQTLIRGALSGHDNLVLGYLIEKDFSIRALTDFLDENQSHKKAVIFRATPRQAELNQLSELLQNHPEVEHLIFDDRRLIASRVFEWHPKRVVISDGFQRQTKNADYGPDSSFPTYIDDIAKMDFAGFGDYLIVGDVYTEGGGMGYVVTLHITASDGPDINVHHFSSDSDSNVRGLPQNKFREACHKLATSDVVLALPRTTGIKEYLNWHAEDHFPGLGSPKQASMQHHMEMMSRYS